MEFIRDQLNIANIPFRENERQRGWTRKAISYILSNEKYIGDSLWQKTYSGDTFPHTQRKNKGEKAKYYVEGTHAAIVEKSVWNAVSELRMQWAGEKHPETYCAPVPFRQKLFVDAAIHCSGSGKTKGAHIGHAGSTIQTVLSAQIVRFQKRCSKKPSAVCTTNLNTTETPSSHRCSQTSKRSATVECSGART